ncbi:MAG: SGNH/GDSL hydrolase family protein [Solirubrobacterales bacterium]|nr:SGNH/GDSL hydrolase family protein [Solirubrobacterales bacterium]MCB8914383.1 SGNH/GDSL hydrolase family protein [Thermoleophilales bacterium]
MTRPRYTLIMTGTNDIGVDRYYGAVPGSNNRHWVSRLVTLSRSTGTIPVISTLPRMLSPDPERQLMFDRGIGRINAGLLRLTRERKVPLVNIWRAVNEPQMVNFGLFDPLHLGIYGLVDPKSSLVPDPAAFTNSVIFTREALRYGANRRNLIMLKTLARLDQAIG